MTEKLNAQSAFLSKAFFKMKDVLGFAVDKKLHTQIVCTYISKAL
jgi:hypothetical protein